MNRPETSSTGEERFRRLADSLPAGIYETDLRGTCVYVNRRWCKTSGFTPEASLGRGWAEAIHPEDRAAVLAKVERSLRSWEPLSVSYRIVAPDGSTRWVTTRSQAMVGADGSPLGVVGVMVDVSELHEANEVIAARARHYRSLLDDAPCGLFEVDPIGDVVWANAAAIALMGLAPGSDTTDQTILGAIHPDDFLAASAVFHTGRASGEPFSITFRAGYPDDYWYLRTTMAPLGGTDGSWVGTLTEAPELVPAVPGAAAEQLAVRKIAHDIHNLVAVINASASSALARLEAGADAAVDVRHVSEASRMIGDLSRSLVGSGAFTADEAARSGCEVAIVVADVVSLLRPFLGERIELVAHTVGHPVTSTLDRAGLERILVNLLLNAREALPGGAGSIRVEAAVRSGGDDVLGAGEFVELAVTDDGEGMDQATAERALEPRFSTRDPEAHAGLGLPTVVDLVAAASGRVALASEAGAGTTVTIVVPALTP